MTDDNKHFDAIQSDGAFDEQLRATAQEMRSQMRPSDETLQATLAAVHLSSATEGHDAPADSVPASPVEVPTSPTGSPANRAGAPAYPAGAPAYPAPISAKKRRRRHALSYFAAAAATVLFVVGGITVFNSINPSALSSGSASRESAAQDTAQNNAASDIITPGSYDEIYESLESRFESNNYDGIVTDEAFPRLDYESSESSSADSAGSMSAEAAPDSAPLAGLGDESGDYSQTNTQVEGVDEADIVKTDGRNIYSLYGDEIIITSAEGRETRELSRIEVKNGVPEDLYIVDDRLVVMSFENDWHSYNDYSLYNPLSFVSLYDISNPLSPQLMNVLGQDGSLRTSRIVDGMLYVVSRYAVYGGYCEPGDPQTFVPSVYSGMIEDAELDSLAEPMSAENIRIAPEYISTEYTVLTTVDVKNASRQSMLSVLGSTETVYMNEDNLFLAATSYEYRYLDAQDDVIIVDPDDKPRRTPMFPWEVFVFIIDPDAWHASLEPQRAPEQGAPRYSLTQTRITRLALEDGYPEVAATTLVDGVLLNQFSLDEYEGYLRVALTVTEDRYTSNGRMKEESSFWAGPLTTNSLVIFDSALSMVGSIENMAPDERIYSARFTGPVGYMVTFRQTDPLFSLDLSNPRSPKIMDALKIPGFSQYLHPYSDGLLLGLGQDASNSGGLTGNLKLSMFDVSNPFNISEENKQLIDAYTSSALYNHKAVLIDEEKNIIGFSVETEQRLSSTDELSRFEWKPYYLIYGYDEKSGFVQRAAFELPEEYEEARALYIGEYLYLVIGNQVGVFSLDTLEEIIWVRM